MKRLLLYLGVRNPVWIVPLAIPIVLYGTQTADRAVLFGLVVAIVVPLSHAISYFLERVFPRSLYLLPLLTVAAVLVTLVELVINISVISAGPRTIALIRSLVVSGLLLYPATNGSAGVMGERFRERMTRVGSITLAFVVGFAAFYLLRALSSTIVRSFADTVAGGFLILAAGRMTITVVHDLRQRRGGSS